MKKVEVSVDFIKEAHQSACANWKQRIEKELPDLFNKLDFNRWLKDDKFPNWLGYYDGKGNFYGIDMNGKWAEAKTDFNPNDCKSNRYATEEEVKTALINEAIKRGFVEGCRYDWEDGKNIEAKGVLSFNFRGHKNDLYFLESSRFIYKNGVWATIITDPTEKELLIERANKVEAELIELKKQINKL